MSTSNLYFGLINFPTKKINFEGGQHSFLNAISAAKTIGSHVSHKGGA